MPSTLAPLVAAVRLAYGAPPPAPLAAALRACLDADDARATVVSCELVRTLRAEDSGHARRALDSLSRAVATMPGRAHPKRLLRAERY